MKMKSSGLLIVLLVTTVTGQQSFSSEPEDYVVREGDDVRLSCVVQDKVGTLQWTRDGFGLGTSRDLSGFSRYQMIGVEEDGEWHLMISNVTLEDDAEYQCQVGATDQVEAIR